uniref:Uncharacterized protein n=1 Tax=Anguilla anguilla TaxID=7936 RepID=A0A0E9VGC7_ANGAN
MWEFSFTREKTTCKKQFTCENANFLVKGSPHYTM